MTWSRQFEDPILLPDGHTLRTLKNAADYIMKLPKAEQNLAEWQTAVHCLIGAAEGREFNPDRKDTHWGKRKLKRDE